MGRADRGGKRLVSDILQQLEGRWSKTAITVQDEGDKDTALLVGVLGVLGNLVLLPCSHGFARGHVAVCWRVRVDARDVNVNGAVEHMNFRIRQEVGEIFLHNMSSAVIATGVAAQQLTATVMPPRDRLAFELRATEGMPGHGGDVFVAEGACCREAIQGGQAKTEANRNGGAKVRVDGEGARGFHPPLSGLVPARGKSNHVSVGALVAL